MGCPVAGRTAGLPWPAQGPGMRETGECERETEIETEGNSSRPCWIELELNWDCQCRWEDIQYVNGKILALETRPNTNQYSYFVHTSTIRTQCLDYWMCTYIHCCTTYIYQYVPGTMCYNIISTVRVLLILLILILILILVYTSTGYTKLNKNTYYYYEYTIRISNTSRITK